MNQFPPSTWVYHNGHFVFFQNFAKIFAAQGVPPVSLTLMANGKKSWKQKNFYNFVWIPLGNRVNIYINFCLQVHFKVSVQPDIVPIICHWCHQHKWNWWQNLPPVLLIPMANLPPVLLIPAAILPPVSLRCRWHRWCTLTCEYLRKFSEKFGMTIMLFSGAWGKVIHEKNLKSRDTVPLSADLPPNICSVEIKPKSAMLLHSSGNYTATAVSHR